MDHHPTSFFILENEQLGTFWVGQVKMRLDENGFSLLPAVTRDELIEKLESKYVEYAQPCLDLVSINKRKALPFYGVERWISRLYYKIKQSPKKFEELEKLLTAGWHEDDFTTNSTLNVLQNSGVDMKELYKRLIKDWEAKGMRCLNTRQPTTYSDRYEKCKKDPDFMYNRARKEVLRHMKNTGKLPKNETLEKYHIKDEEIKECMGRRGIIYKITSPSGKVYVGQTIRSFEKRMQEHKREYSECTLLKRAIDKYKDEMKYEIIEDNVPQEQLDEREIYWIKELNSLAPNGYNCNSGGKAEQVVSQETKDNISAGKYKVSIEKKGYVGEAIRCGSVFRPRIGNFYLSDGAFYRIEDAIEVLKEYTKDPKNFTKVEGTYKKPIGCVRKRLNTWQLRYKGKHVGNYATQEEAEEARKTLQSSTYISSSESC